jgi:hypothetical protein
MPPSLTDSNAFTSLKLLSCELLANPATVSDVLMLNVHTKHPHELYHARKAWDKTLHG